MSQFRREFHGGRLVAHHADRASAAAMTAMATDFHTIRAPVCEDVAEALVMPVATIGGRQRGGVRRADGSFVAHSGVRRGTIDYIGPHDSPPAPEAPERHGGQHLFCGHLDPHFGHFLLESLARLWAGLEGDVPGRFVFQVRRGGGMPAFAREFLALAGIVDRVLLVDAPAVFERLLVPEPAYEINGPYHDAARAPFRRIADAVRTGGIGTVGRRLYLSRTRLPYGRVYGEEVAEACFARAGYEIVHPQEHAVRDQVAMILAAESVAGVTGSALHALLFSEGVRATYLVRGPGVSNNYPASDQMTGTRSDYLFVGADAPLPAFGQRTPHLLDLDALRRTLPDIGVPPPGASMDQAALQAAYEADWRAGLPEWLERGGQPSPELAEWIARQGVPMPPPAAEETPREGRAVPRLRGGTMGAIEPRPTTDRNVTMQPMTHSVRRLSAFKDIVGARRYLEVGVANGDTFHALEFETQVAVDVSFRFDPSEFERPGRSYHEMPSDDYFTNVSRTSDRFDVIFLDGLHTFEQTLRDFACALTLIDDDGIILIDDVFPNDVFSALPTPREATERRTQAGLTGGAWHGDVYKVIFAINDFFPNVDFRTIFGSGNPQTVVIKRPREGFQTAFNDLEAISRMGYFELIEPERRQVMRPGGEEPVMDWLRRSLT